MKIDKNYYMLALIALGVLFVFTGVYLVRAVDAEILINCFSNTEGNLKMQIYEQLTGINRCSAFSAHKSALGVGYLFLLVGIFYCFLALFGYFILDYREKKKSHSNAILEPVSTGSVPESG